MKRIVAITGVVLAGLWGSVAAGEIVVSAASSLTSAFKELGREYEVQHPGINVLISFAASDVLQRQIVNGAPVDIFASADQVAMDKAVQGGAVDETDRRDFARNEVVLVAPADDAFDIKSVDDLGSKRITRIGVGNPETVPVGRYTQAFLQDSGQWDGIKEKLILGQSVRQVLDYVARGEVDAAFVFATDAAVMADRVKVIQRLASPSLVSYSIALVKRNGRNPEAVGFLDYVLSGSGQAVLEKYGFGRP